MNIAEIRKAVTGVAIGLAAAVANGLIYGTAALVIGAVTAGLIGAGVYTIRNAAPMDQ